MSIILGILKFIFSGCAIFLTWVLINIISSVINPQIVIENDQPVEKRKNNNARFMFALIIAICWAICNYITIMEWFDEKIEKNK